MAVQSRALINTAHTLDQSSLVTSITSLLQNLNPKSFNPKNISSSPLNQFSPYLDPSLVTEVIKKQTIPYHALFFFNWASKPSHNPHNDLHTHSCYAAITDILLSHSFFSVAFSVLEKSQKLNDFFISKFIKANGDRGNIKGAIFWFHKAKAIEKGRCLFSCNAILGVLVGANKINLAKSIFDQTVKDGVVQPDVSTYTTLIRGFCKLGRIDDAKKMFDEMPCAPNSLTYNTMINGLCKKSDMETARFLVNRMMRSRNCLPDTVTYTTLIDGYCKKGELEEAIQCMDEMVKFEGQPNVLTYNAIIYGLCVNGKVDDAKRMMSKMRLSGFKENVATHTSILKGLCVAGRSKEAIEYLKQMITSKMEPDAKCYGVVVNECCKMKKPDQAISFLKEMRVRGMNPAVSSFNAVFRILAELGEFDRAISLLRQMPQMGCLPNFVSYSTVICSLCMTKGRMQEVEELVGNMLQNRHDIDASMYSCLVKGHWEDGNEARAVNIFYEAIKNKYIINVESFSILVKKLCAKGKVVEAEKIFEEMCESCPVVDVDNYRRVLAEHVSMSSSSSQFNFNEK